MERRRFTSREKLEIVLEGLREGGEVAEVCRRRGISTTQFYTWKKKLVEGAGTIFKRKSDGRDREMERLREELRPAEGGSDRRDHSRQPRSKKDCWDIEDHPSRFQGDGVSFPHCC